MKCCVLIPCYNHAATLGAVAAAARAHAPVLIVDDGSTVPIPEVEGCTLLRLPRNQGKAAALRAGFRRAAELGYTHVITMDADGQHDAADLPRFLAAAREQPGALVLGVRDFVAAGAPAGRRRSNAVSSFWFRVETGVRLGDTQCGFRCYPLALALELKVRSGGYAYELEFMVRASWAGTPVVPVPIRSTYEPDQIRNSHFRPIRDLLHITLINARLVLQCVFVPRHLRAAWSRGQKVPWRQALKDFFTDHADDPGRMALAVGLGLFCGIAPIWGYQMVAAATLAHLFRLNKAIALVASNISIPPFMPIILFTALALGHWLFRGQWIDFSPGEMTRDRALEYLWQWVVGSLVLGVLVAIAGTLAAYGLARMARKP